MARPLWHPSIVVGVTLRQHGSAVSNDMSHIFHCGTAGNAPFLNPTCQRARIPTKKKRRVLATYDVDNAMELSYIIVEMAL